MGTRACTNSINPDRALHHLPGALYPRPLLYSACLLKPLYSWAAGRRRHPTTCCQETPSLRASPKPLSWESATTGLCLGFSYLAWWVKAFSGIACSCNRARRRAGCPFLTGSDRRRCDNQTTIEGTNVGHATGACDRERTVHPKRKRAARQRRTWRTRVHALILRTRTRGACVVRAPRVLDGPPTMSARLRGYWDVRIPTSYLPTTTTTTYLVVVPTVMVVLV